MNILVLNWRDMEHPEAGGAEVHVVELFSRLVDRGHTVTLLTTRFKGCAPSATQGGIEVLRRGGNYTFHLEAPFLVRKLLKRRRYDCIIDDVNKLPFLTHLWFPSQRCATFFLHFLGRTLFGMANPVMALYVYVMERLYPLFYGRLQCCTISMSTAAELIAKGFPERNITIVETGIDVGRFKPDPAVEREDGLLLCVGRLKRYKRVDAVFEAMRLLDGRGFGTRLIVAGTGDDMPRLKRRVSELGLGGRVEFAGFISEERKIELLRRAAVFVNTSEKEGWGITNVEAAACGTPVVANNAPGLRESVADGETGLLYKENDVRSLADSLEKMLDGREFRERLGERGRLWAQKFSWDESSKRVEEWLCKVVREK